MRQDALALREVRVRTVRPDEEPRWNELMRERHYLGFRNFCGKRLRQVAVHGERWLALIGWHAAALHCAARDRWIGWSSLQRRQRLFLVANQSRFLLLSEAGSSPHLASRVLGLSLRQLPREWQRLHGSALLLAESFVDPARFAGTCYRAANWLEVGATQGFGRVRGGAIGYRHHGAPKRVFVYPLRRDARQQLAAARAQPAWRPHQPRLMLNDAQWRSLRSFLDQVPDTRSRRGLRYPMRTALAILLGSRLAGCQTLTELSDFGRALSPQTLAAIGSRRRPQTGRYEAPCISSWHDLLKRIDAAEVERLLAAWTAAQVLGNPEDSADGEAPLRAIAMDGKVLRGSYDRDLGADGVLLDKPAQQQLSALDLDSGTVVGQLGFSGQKEDAEGAALRALARTCADSGRCVIADALHTQRGTAQELLGLGLDFVFTVKANQPNVLAQVHEGFHWDCLSAHQSLSCEHGRIETRSIRVADELDPTVPYVDFPGVRFVAQLRRQVESKKDGRKRKPETVYLLTSLPPEQAPPRRLLRLNRCYWGIENRIHWVRDVALREDHSRIRKGTLPRLLAAFANFAILLLRLLKTPNIKRRMAHLRLHPNQAVALLLGCTACTPSLCPAGRLVGQGPATPAARRAVAIRPRSCSAARPSALTHPAHSAHCRPSTRLPHPEQCAYRPSGPNIEFACASFHLPVPVPVPVLVPIRLFSCVWSSSNRSIRVATWSRIFSSLPRALSTKLSPTCVDVPAPSSSDSGKVSPATFRPVRSSLPAVSSSSAVSVGIASRSPRMKSVSPLIAASKRAPASMPSSCAQKGYKTPSRVTLPSPLAGTLRPPTAQPF